MMGQTKKIKKSDKILEMRVKACERALSLFTDEKVKSYCEELIKNADDYFFIEAASSSGKYHPKYANGEGGLLRHSMAVTILLNDIFYTNMYEFTDYQKNLLLCAALVHDIKKYGDGESGRTVKNHPELAVEYVKSIKSRIMPEEDISFICEAIISHMGVWGSIKPETDAQKVVHIADCLASQKHILIDFDGSDEAVEELLTETAVEPKDYELPFGKFKGATLGTVPEYYLHWLAEEYPRKSHPAVKNAKKLLKG